MTTTESQQLTPHISAELLRKLEARIDVPFDRELIPIVAPFSGHEIGTTRRATSSDISAAVAHCRRAQPGWAALSVKTRARIIARFHDLLIDRADTALDLSQLEAGKARVAAFEEVFDALATARYYSNTASRLLKRKRRAVSFPLLTRAYEYAHPLGVVGFIAPWNFPFTLGISDAIPALLAGNGVVIKPDEKTPYCTLLAASIMDEAGIPPGLIQVVTGEGKSIGPPLIDEVDFVMFTGSTAVGRKVAEQAGRRLIGSSMELGGKNAALVLADADLDTAIPGVVRGVFANGGQLCIAAERIYVDVAIASEFTRRFVEAIQALPLVADYRFAGPVSAMIDPEHVEAVHRHVEDAVAKGAELLVGGKPRPDVGPTFYEPTVLTGVDESMLVCRSETFGPVVSIYPVSDSDTAVRLANDSEYGLSYSVWTANTSQGVEIAQRLKAGTVSVNDGYASTWSTYDAPMGGMMASGLGRRHGKGGLMKYTEAQTVAVQQLGPAFAPPGDVGYDAYQRFLSVALKILRHVPFYK